MEKIRSANRPPDDPVRVLNLFGYTGGGDPGLYGGGGAR